MCTVIVMHGIILKLHCGAVHLCTDSGASNCNKFADFIWLKFLFKCQNLAQIISALTGYIFSSDNNIIIAGYKDKFLAKTFVKL